MTEVEKTLEQERRISIRLLLQYNKFVKFDVVKSSYELSQLKNVKPHLNYQLNPSYRDLGSDVYEMMLALKLESITAEAKEEKDKDKIFELEVAYCGIFKLEGAWDVGVIEEMFLVDCATLLFPFVRQEVANITVGSGYAPILLEPMNLRELYTQYKNSRTIN
ncbi:hypothetical protein EDM53_00950 [Rickettsiales endosymbiont of Peranema trichophorum]|uniref:protein-export chaperone SecB n=1 Tax=Rickettsiales endosymbiont of Peranema trichophorum TaxID=2486577 RepID=UPI0010234249|nr:protein-export chaperone SecB [Rickettsiales endosymbiont of Peranema trichophorum]RZI47633.1 hypothetical protein EDM53_00950 [Rickettsiales endosymbiont of Peranema trichophorum]